MTQKRYRLLATDFDGTLATDGQVSAETLVQLQHWKSEGGRIVLVTGRELEELQRAFPAIQVCDLVIAENGALLYRPESGQIELLGDRPPTVFIEELRKRGVNPLSVGRSIVATAKNNEIAVQNALTHLKLSLQVILNVDAVMILPLGVDKGSGLKRALKELGIPRSECVAVGDAENDLTLFEAAGLSCAVSNAVPVARAQAMLQLGKPGGEGVCELLKGLRGGLYGHQVA
jgi:HAD superfamily hydrolase (TIGR01484 family)